METEEQARAARPQAIVKKAKLAAELKEAEKVVKKAEREAKKAQKEAEREAKKAEKEAEKQKKASKQTPVPGELVFLERESRFKS